MLLSKALANSQWLVLCVALCTVSTVHSQKVPRNKPFIKVYPRSKDYFWVQNMSTCPLILYVDDVYVGGVKGGQGVVLAKRKRSKSKDPYPDILEFPNDSITENSKLRVRYSKELYDRDVAHMNQLEKEYKDKFDSRTDIDEDARDIIDEMLDGERKNGTERDFTEFKKVALKGITRLMDLGALRTYIREMRGLKMWRKDLKQVYEASSGQDNNDYSEQFEDITIYDKIVSKKGVIGSRYLNLGVTMLKSSLGTNWDKKGSEDALYLSTSWEASFQQKLFRDIRWGKSRLYSGLFLGVSYDHFVHNLRNEEKDIYVGAAYVDNPTTDFYSIISEEETTLRTDHFSVNLLLHNFFYEKKVFIDVGIGYNIYQTATIHFNKDINHLSGGASLSRRNYRDVIDFDEQSPWYGMVRFGFSISQFTLFLSSKLQNRNLLPNDDFELYEQLDDTSFQKIDISEEKEFFYRQPLKTKITKKRVYLFYQKIAI